MPFSVTDALDREVERLYVERPPDDWWHPSQLSGCLRQTIYQSRGTPESNPRDARSKRILRVGHIVHEFTQDGVGRHPEVLASYAEVRITHPYYRVTGSVDQIVQLAPAVWVVIEYKTINSMAFKYRDLPKPEHERQLVAYLVTLRDFGSADSTIGPLGDSLAGGRIVYISKDDLRIEECEVFLTPAREQELASTVAELEAHKAAGTLPPRLPLEPDPKTSKATRSWRCRYCPYQDLCWGEGGPIQ